MHVVVDDGAHRLLLPAPSYMIVCLDARARTLRRTHRSGERGAARARTAPLAGPSDLVTGHVIRVPRAPGDGMTGVPFTALPF